MWQVNDDGLSSLLDVAELLGVRGLKSDRRPDPSKARKPHASTSFCMFLPVLWIRIRSRIRNKSFRIHNFDFYNFNILSRIIEIYPLCEIKFWYFFTWY